MSLLQKPVSTFPGHAPCEYKAAAGKVKRPRSQYCQAEPSPSNPVADVISRTAPAVACRPD
jgi:hypothetical protein